MGRYRDFRKYSTKRVERAARCLLTVRDAPRPGQSKVRGSALPLGVRHPVWPKLGDYVRDFLGDYVRDFDDAQRPALLACWLWEMICNRAEGAVAFEYIRHV